MLSIRYGENTLEQKNKTVGIVGAGLSSLYAACMLSKEGFKVTVFEKNEMPGGRCQIFKAEGFTFDMGPSWYWMPDLIDQLFADLGEKREDYYSIKRLDPGYQVFWKDNTSSQIPADKAQLSQLFDKLEERGGEKLDLFLKDAETKYEVAKPLMENPGLKVGELVKWEVLKNAMKLDIFKSVDKDVSRRFVSEKARSILNFPVLFLGAMPHQIPSLYTLMNYADLQLGTWYPEGGMHDLPLALEKIARDNGAEFHYGEGVEHINAQNGVVSGLTTEKRTYQFDYVISGADYHFTEQKLLPKSYRKYSEVYWDKRKLAPSSLIFYLGIGRKIDGLEHHNLFFDEDLNDHGKQIYDTPSWPEKPLFYVCAPSKTDDKVAPEGSENLFVLMPVAPELDDNEEIRQKYLDIVLERLEKHTGVDIRGDINYQRSFCVSDFKTEYNSYKGNAYGLANTLTQTANLKPRMKSKLKNMYYCGQLTVPGPGIPPAMISGKIAAKQIIRS